MNDEQFEEEMCALEDCGHDDFVEALRARDTAQREALARVEAERDRWIGHYNHLMEQHMPRTGDGCEKGWSRVVEARELQAQLAEAAALLDRLFLSKSYVGLEAIMVDVGAFLARHAQAEQQEAQGAQAGDERAAFESWTRLHNESLKDDCPDQSEDIKLDTQGGVYCWSNTDCAWQAWKARAALATQPAVRGAEHEAATKFFSAQRQAMTKEQP